MTLLLIVCDASLEERLLQGLREIGVPGHTRITGATGSGRTGRRDGDPIWPGNNTLLLVVVSGAEIVNSIRDMILRLKADYSHPPALHVFTLAAEELL